jgi:hypothetical protein
MQRIERNTYTEENIHADKYCTRWRERNLVERVKTEKTGIEYSTHETDGLSDNTRKSMDDVHYWIKPVYECPISIPIILERMSLYLKKFEYCLGGITGM